MHSENAGEFQPQDTKGVILLESWVASNPLRSQVEHSCQGRAPPKRAENRPFEIAVLLRRGRSRCQTRLPGLIGWILVFPNYRPDTFLVEETGPVIEHICATSRRQQEEGGRLRQTLSPSEPVKPEKPLREHRPFKLRGRVRAGDHNQTIVSPVPDMNPKEPPRKSAGSIGTPLRGEDHAPRHFGPNPSPDAWPEV